MPLHCAFSPQLSDFTVTFNRTHCGPHKSDTTTFHKIKRNGYSFKWLQIFTQIILCSFNMRHKSAKKWKYYNGTYRSANYHLRLDLCRKVWPIFYHRQPMVLYRVEFLQLHHNVHVPVELLGTLLLQFDVCGKEANKNDWNQIE